LCEEEAMRSTARAATSLAPSSSQTLQVLRSLSCATA